MPSPTTTLLPQRNSHTESSPHASLPTSTPCLKLSFDALSQKHSSHVGGIPAGFHARPPLHLNARWAGSQSLPHPQPVLTGHPRQPLAAAPELPRGEQSQFHVWVHTSSWSHWWHGHGHAVVVLCEG